MFKGIAYLFFTYSTNLFFFFFLLFPSADLYSNLRVEVCDTPGFKVATPGETPRRIGWRETIKITFRSAGVKQLKLSMHDSAIVLCWGHRHFVSVNTVFSTETKGNLGEPARCRDWGYYRNAGWTRAWYGLPIFSCAEPSPTFLISLKSHPITSISYFPSHPRFSLSLSRQMQKQPPLTDLLDFPIEEW